MPVVPIFLRPREAAALAGLATRAINGAINPGNCEPCPYARGCGSRVTRSTRGSPRAPSGSSAPMCSCCRPRDEIWAAIGTQAAD